MPARTPDMTAAQEAELRGHVTAGLSLREIATAMSITVAYVRREMGRLQLAVGRADAMAAAQATRVLSMRERRIAAAEKEMELLEWAQQRVDLARNGGEWKTIMKGDKGAEDDVTLDFVPSRDLRDETNVRAAASTIIARLDTSDPGVAEGLSMLERLASIMGVNGPTE